MTIYISAGINARPEQQRKAGLERKQYTDRSHVYHLRTHERNELSSSTVGSVDISGL
jgi:hypothetical protein